MLRKAEHIGFRKIAKKSSIDNRSQKSIESMGSTKKLDSGKPLGNSRTHLEVNLLNSAV